MEMFWILSHFTAQGLGSDDDTIVRIFVSRSEQDLAKIAKKFKEFSGRELDKALEQVKLMCCDLT